mgnify:CR=1|tara:strand:+ start:113 stop:313 length:201 start_codon:yes stop_codon:yes gene_type:complete
MDGEQQPEAPVPAPEEAQQPAEAQESPEQPLQEGVPQDDLGAEGPGDLPSEQQQIMQEHQMMEDQN